MHIKIDTGSSPTLTTDELQPGMVVRGRNGYVYLVGSDSRDNINIIGIEVGDPIVLYGGEIEGQTWTPISDYTITISSKE